MTQDNLVKDIAIWNYLRDNTEYDKELEYSMLVEELEEYGVSRNLPNAAKELADIIFVAIGSLYKLTGNNIPKVEGILKIVTDANYKKGTEKVGGKVLKGTRYTNPEAAIGVLLEEAPRLYTDED